MDDVKIFRNEQFGESRSIMINNEPWFVGKDVALVLGYKDTKDAIRKHVDEEDKLIVHKWQIPTLDIPNRGITIINKFGFYSLIFESKALKGDEGLRHWVMDEIFPSMYIRKINSNITGIYEGSINGAQMTGGKAMENVKTFSNEKFGQIRVVIINDKPWFVGKDVAMALGYSNPRKVLLDHVYEEDKGVTKCDTLGGKQNLTIINESGLYSLIYGSKLESAKKFKHWVTNEVLPSIRKHGAYMTDEIIERTLTDPDYLIQLATALKEERQARRLAEQTLEEQKPMVDFANQVSDSNNLINMGQMAKLLKDENINVGRNRSFEWLRNKDVLMKDNIPYQRYIDKGYFQLKESVYQTPGGAKTQLTTYVTGKGQIYITEKLRAEWE